MATTCKGSPVYSRLASPVSTPVSRASVRIYTFKEGLLSRVAHDLRIRVEQFNLELDQGALRGRFQAASLRVEGAMRKNALDRSALSRGDLAKIEATIRDEILQVRRYPEIVWDGAVEDSSGGRVRVRGTLGLVGREQPLSLTLDREGSTVRGRVSFAPSRWGIRPYRALAGALKLQDRVIVELELDAPDDAQAHVWEPAT